MQCTKTDLCDSSESFDNDAQSSNQSIYDLDSDNVNLSNNLELRRISTIFKPLCKWWKSSTTYTPLNANTSDSFESSDIFLVASDLLQSYEEAIHSENIDFWRPAIKRKEDCILENITFLLVERQPGMHVIP
eukprot:IDg17659t1